MAVPTFSEQQQALIAANRDEYAAIYERLSFIPADAAGPKEQDRETLLTALASTRFTLDCRATKPHTGPLSPGCRLCAAGAWSCLFINGRCNLSCFYCPGRQDETGQPATNNLTFHTPAAYVAYLEQFGFRGMSLSGGEPLLTLQRTLTYLGAAKKHFGERLHSWLYTNGSLVNPEILAQLRDRGLDEIRFDIGALDYSLDQVALAVGVIPTVTVEIPAVPEELPRLRQKLHTMAQIGVDYLNLHQLRLTSYNFPRFVGRPYRYLHGEKITVLESELAALELMAYGHEQQLELPINYCSFVYKNRYQKGAARGRGATLMAREYERVTAAGYLRTLSLRGDAGQLRRVAEKLKTTTAAPHDWALTRSADQLFFSADLWRHIDCSGLRLNVVYSETPVRETLSYRHPFREIRLPGDQKIVIERIPVQEFTFPGVQAPDYFAVLADTKAVAGTPQLLDVLLYEQLPAGLQTYF